MIKCQLKSILKGLNLTQKELCERINARPSTICALCNNTFDYLNIHLLWNCQEMCSRGIPKIMDRQESGGVMRELL